MLPAPPNVMSVSFSSGASESNNQTRTRLVSRAAGARTGAARSGAGAARTARGAALAAGTAAAAGDTPAAAGDIPPLPVTPPAPPLPPVAEPPEPVVPPVAVAPPLALAPPAPLPPAPVRTMTPPAPVDPAELTPPVDPPAPLPPAPVKMTIHRRSPRNRSCCCNPRSGRRPRGRSPPARTQTARASCAGNRVAGHRASEHAFSRIPASTASIPHSCGAASRLGGPGRQRIGRLRRQPSRRRRRLYVHRDHERGQRADPDGRRRGVVAERSRPSERQDRLHAKWRDPSILNRGRRGPRPARQRQLSDAASRSQAIAGLHVSPRGDARRRHLREPRLRAPDDRQPRGRAGGHGERRCNPPRESPGSS